MKAESGFWNTAVESIMLLSNNSGEAAVLTFLPFPASAVVPPRPPQKKNTFTISLLITGGFAIICWAKGNVELSCSYDGHGDIPLLV